MMYRWTGAAGDGDTNNPKNWDPEGVPQATERHVELFPDIPMPTVGHDTTLPIKASDIHGATKGLSNGPDAS